MQEKAKGIRINPADIAGFHCRVHPSEKIVRVCTEPNCENPFLCIECIINHEPNHKNYIVKIDEFVGKVQNEGSRMASYASSSKLPSKFQNYIKSEAENLAMMSTHIENQKTSAKMFFDQ